ncbi:major facilitator superfamily domain-containing protein [Microdochium trichocladiopsis]|uniref:Major facilitator superfamily domain-containing protein n=1 Tax=Microdochium trichocladiopsis TaxID=1682393 RepID=A0A9P8Y9Q1_9PEZI|nr:major facilitator superfamily domain-containing protein [Microdochium trichocladiopsis]KAH7033276.1 major facilitator superfamily domain-containing protein [Microdochium trichocladiopsis]
MSTTTTQTIQGEVQSIPLAYLQPAKDSEAPAQPSSPAPDAVSVEQVATPVAKLLVAGFSFFCAGANDGTLGPLIPYIIASFRIGTGEVAIIYATTFAGWLLAGITNPVLTAHLTLGQLLAIGAALQLAAQCLRPDGSLALFCVSFFLQTLGMAYQDSHSNTFVSGLKNVPHRWLSFIHACYAGGCLVGPLIATAIANAPNSMAIPGWRRVYLVMIGFSFVNVVGVFVAFHDTLWTRLNGPSNNEGSPEQQFDGAPEPGLRPHRNRAAFQELGSIMKSRCLWTISMFYFFYLGAAFTASGWVVEFLTTVRGGDLANMGYIPTGFYAGTFAGRILLSEPTFRWGERRMILIYSILCVGLQLVFWLQPNIIGSAVALSLIGFFFGPFFPTGMSLASKLFSKKSQPAALGFIFVIAQAGAAIFPSITGIIATRVGVAVLQPIVLALVVLSGVCWWFVPRVAGRKE